MTCPCTATAICAEHQQSFLDILADVPDRLATMMVSIAKQSVTGGQGGSVKNDDNRPLPVNIGASEARHALRSELVSVIVRVRYCLGEGPRPGGDVPAACAWLARLMPRMAQHPECPDWYHRIRTAYDKTTKAIDTPPERVRAGECAKCLQTLYTVEGHEMVRCRTCSISYNVGELQDATLAKLMSYTSTATNIIRVLSAHGTKIRLTRLTKWADRGQVPCTLYPGDRLFTIRDVLDTYEAMSKSAK